MGSRFFSILILASGPACAGEIVDRLAVTAGQQAITVSEILHHIRLTAFLNREPVNLSPEAKRQAAERLIEQGLIRREMELSRYALPGIVEVEPLLDELKKDPRLAGDGAFQRELARYGISESDLRERLLWQITLLRFVEYRFRPGVQVPEQVVAAYYTRQLLPQWNKQRPGEPAPSLAERRLMIEELLAQKLVDEALDRWLKQSRSQTKIRFLEEAFR